MPFNGKNWDVYCLEYNVSSTATVVASGSGYAIYSHSATGTVSYAPDAIAINTGIQLDVISSFDEQTSTGVWLATVSIPALGLLLPFSAPVYLSAVSVSLRIYGVKIYGRNLGSALRLKWDSIGISVNGGAYTPYAIGFDADGAGTGPNYIPFLGIPIKIEGLCVADRIGVGPGTWDACDPEALEYSWSTEVSSQAQGGWRFQEVNGGSWTTLPVAPKVVEAPRGIGCSLGTVSSGIISATNTNDLTVNCYDYFEENYLSLGQEIGDIVTRLLCCEPFEGEPCFEMVIPGGTAIDPCGGGTIDYAYQYVYSKNRRRERKFGSVMGLPNLERDFMFLGGDTKALIYRAPMPKVEVVGGRTCNTNGTIYTGETTTTVYPEMGELLSVVSGTSHVLFTALLVSTVYAPTTTTHEKSESTQYEGFGTTTIIGDGEGSCPDGLSESKSYGTTLTLPDDSSYLESSSSVFPSDVATWSGYQSHNEPLARYCASWPNPHWHVGYAFFDWTIDGAPVPTIDYTSLLREQFLYQSSLLPAEKLRKRNHIIGSPIENEQGNVPFLDAHFKGLRWIGASRFQLLETQIPSTLTLSVASPGEWTVRYQSGTPDMAVTLGAGGLTLNTFAVAEGWLELPLGAWGTSPYMLLALAKTIKADWDLTNVTSIEVYLVNVANQEHLLTSTRNVEVTIPRMDASKYSGSWAQNWGLAPVTDLGTDLLPAGDSLAAMGDSQRVTASQLSSDTTWKSVRFKITPSGVGNIILKWPVFKLWNTHPKIVWESGKFASLLWPSGPAIRWGQTLWYIDGLGIQDPPLVNPPGLANTWVDGMCFNHRVLKGDGGTLSVTLPAETFVMFDSFEGQSVSDADRHTHSWILPKGSDDKIRIALVHSFSEIPPMACFPVRKRSLLDWSASGNHAQVVYDQVELTRKIVSPYACKLIDATSSTVGGSISTIPGWYIWGFSPELTNSEVNWKIAVGSTNYANIRPWHGFYWTGAPSVSIGKCIDVHYTPLNEWNCVVIENGTVKWFPSDIIVAENAKWADIEIGTGCTYIDVLFPDGTRKRYFGNTFVKNLETVVTMEDFRNAIDPSGKILVIHRDSSNKLYSSYNSGAIVDTGVTAEDGLYDVSFTLARFELTTKTGATFVHHYSYDYGETWI